MSTATATLKTGTATATLGTGSLNASVKGGATLTANLKEAGAVASGYGTEYQAVYDALTTPPGATVAGYQNTMVEALVDAGYWAGLDIFYCFAQTTNGAGEALVNWINPALYAATAYNSPAFVALEGFTSDGTTAYIDTGINFGDGGTYNFARDDAMIGVYIKTNVIETRVEFGVLGLGDVYFYVSAGNAAMRINDDSNLLIAHADSRGMWLVTRTGANKNLFRNGATLGNKNTSSTGVVNADMYLLAWNNNGPGLFSNRQVSFWFAGKFSTMDAAAITTIIETYMDANGKGVIT